MILFLIVFCLLVAIGFGLASAISDFKSMTIPNLYALCVVLAFVPAYLADAMTGNGLEFFASWKNHVAAAVAMFALTFLMFIAKVIGAGDSKLCAAFALWVGLTGLAPYLFYMAVLGAVLGAATKIMGRKAFFVSPKEGSWIARSQAGEAGVPYGIAICFGAVIAFYLLGYFSPEKLALLTGYTENNS